MAEFKVGDKVICVRAHLEFMGSTGTITSIAATSQPGRLSKITFDKPTPNEHYLQAYSDGTSLCHIDDLSLLEKIIFNIP